MLSLDLFNSRYEKELREGAVDKTIARMIEPLSLKAADIRTKIRAGGLDPREIDQLEKEYEDLVQKRLDIILDRQPKTEQQQPPVKGQPGKGIGDIQDPKTKMAQLAQKAKKGPLANVGAGLKGFLTGKQEPVDEQQAHPRAYGVANFQRLVKANANNYPTADLEFSNPKLNVKLDKRGLELISDYYDGLETDQMKSHFIYRVLPSGEETRRVLRQLGWQENVQQPLPGISAQGELPLSEKKKFDKPEDIQAGDTRVARELQKLRAQYPAAKSDIEAVASSEIDSNERNQQKLAAISGANEKQDALLRQLVALDQEQGREIDDLDKENNSLEKRLAQVQTTNDKLQAALTQMTGTKKTPAKAKTDAEVGGIIDIAPDVAPSAPEPETPVKSRRGTAKSSAIAQMAKIIPGLPKPEISTLAKPDAGKPDEKTSPTDDMAKQFPTMGRIKPDTVAANQPELDLGPQPKAVGSDVREHGGGVGPKKHWQSLMREQGRPPMDTLNYYFPDINAQSDVEAIRAAIRQIMDNPELSKTSKQRLLGQVGMMVQRNRALIGREWRQYLDRFTESQHNEGWSDQGNPTAFSVYIDGREWKAFASDEQARRVADKVRANLKLQGRDQKVTIAPSRAKQVKETFAMPGTTIPRKSIIQGYTVFFNPETRTVSVTRGGDSEEAAIEQARIGTVNLKTFRQAAERLIDRIDDQLINEGIRDTASATAVVACLLAGGGLQGCATAPQQTTTAQAVKTGQDVGRIIYNAKKITRAGTEEEARQEMRNILRGMTTRPEEMNTSNIMRIWRRVNQPAPEPQNEAKEIKTRDDFLDARDYLLRKVNAESNPVNKQIIKAEIRKLESQAEAEGWIAMQQRLIREDTAALAAEDAILKRIFVKHRNLMMEYGPDKITQAAEEVSYNVGDIAHISDEQITEWVRQVEYILGAKP